MSQSLKKEIEALVVETINELGHVSHARSGIGPIHTGFAKEPLSRTSQQAYLDQTMNAHWHLAKALEQLSIVTNELSDKGYSNDLVLVKDQISQSLQQFEKVLTDQYGDLLETKKKRKCKCPDGSKSENCCKKGWTQRMKKGPIAGKLTHKLGITMSSSAINVGDNTNVGGKSD